MIIPGTSSKVFLSTLRSIPKLLAARLGVIPETDCQGIIGSCPRFCRTKLARETFPLAKSKFRVTVPSVTDILTLLTPGSLFTALLAFIAQSVQSIPLIFHSIS